MKTVPVVSYGDEDRKHLVNFAPSGAVRTANLAGAEDVRGPRLAADDYIEAILDGDFPSIDADHPFVVHFFQKERVQSWRS